MGAAFNPSVATVPNANANADANPVGKGAHLSTDEKTALHAVVKETVNKKLDFGGDTDSQAAKALHTKKSTDKPADSATTEAGLRWAQNVNGKNPEAVQVFLDRLQFADPKAYDYISNYLGIQARGETRFGADADSQAAKRLSRRSVGDPPADSATVDGALRWAQNVNRKDPAAVQKVLDKLQTTDRKAYDYMSNMLGIQATGEMWFGPDDDAQAAKRLYRKSAGDPPADAETKQGALRWLSSVKDPETAKTYLAAVKVNDPTAYEYLSHNSSQVAVDQKNVAIAADRVANATTSEEVSAAESDLNKSVNTTISDLEARNVELAAVYEKNSIQRPIGRGNYEKAPANEAGKAAANEIQQNNKLIEDFKKATLPTFIGTGAVAGPSGFGPPPPMGYVAPPDLPPGTDLKTVTAHLTPAQADYLGWSIAQGILKKQVQVPPGDVQKWNTLAIWQKENNDYYKTLSPTTEPPAANMGRVVTKDPIEFSKNITNNLVAKGSFNVFNQMPESAGKQFLDFFETASMFIPIPGLDAIGAAFKVGKEAVGGAVRGARGAFGAGAEGIAGASGRAARPLGGLETSGDIVIKQGSAEAKAGGSEAGSGVHKADGINLDAVSEGDLQTATRLAKSHDPSVKQTGWDSMYVGDGTESQYAKYFWAGALDTAKMVKEDKPFIEVLGNSGNWRKAIAEKEGTKDSEVFGKWIYQDAKGDPTGDVTAIASAEQPRTPVTDKYRNAENAEYFDNLKSGRNGPYGDSVIADADGNPNFKSWTTVGKIGDEDINLTTTSYTKLGEHEGFQWLHGVENEKDLPKVYDHIQTLYEEARAPLKGATPEARLKELNEKVGHLHWWISQVCPFERGSAAAADMISTAIYRAQGFDRSSWKPGVSADVAALTTPDEATFAKNYGDLMDRPPSPSA